MNKKAAVAIAGTASALAVALVVAISNSGTSQAGPAEKPSFDFEKCFGVVKAGKNDCQTANSSCAGTSRSDAQADAWLYLPAGVCTKIVGGSTEVNEG